MKWVNFIDVSNGLNEQSIKSAAYLEYANEIVIDKDKLYLVLYGAGLSRQICDQIITDIQPYEMRFGQNK